jgi:uncharacterized delta-60 repeat protein
LIDDYAESIRVQPDGKILVVGTAYNTGQDSFVARFLPNGALDTSFAGDGTFVISLGAGDDGATSVSQRADGRIVVMARDDTGGTYAPVLFQLQADGTLDPAFGTAGVSRPAFAWAGGFMDNVTVADDGSLRAFGYVLVGAQIDSAVFGIAANGSIDTTYGGGDGIAAVAVQPTTSDLVTSGLTLPDGRMVAVGWGVDASSEYGIVVTHLTKDGSIDSDSGGADGSDWNVLGAGVNGGAYKAALLEDGRVAFAGFSAPSGSENTMVGILDSTTVDDYSLGVSDFSTGASGAFGACLASTDASAVNWPEAGTCNTASAADWRAIPVSSTTIASESSPVDATASLRFGVRYAAGQRPGRYIADVSFETVAPAI